MFYVFENQRRTQWNHINNYNVHDTHNNNHEQVTIFDKLISIFVTTKSCKDLVLI